MSISVTKNQSWAVEVEDTEGTYKAPQASTSFVQILADGAEMSRSKEVIERNIFNSSIGQTSPRTGQFTAACTIPVEARAHSTEGAAPEFDKLMRSALGSKRTIATTTTTKSSGNTDDTLQIQDADISKFEVGDIVMVKQDDAYHVSPIASKTTGTGTASITLLVPHPDGDMDDSVVIAKATSYTVADAGHPSLSVSRYIEGAVLQQVTGAKVNKMSLDGFKTGGLPSFKFELEGLNFDSSLTSPPYAASYDSQLPPIVLNGRVYMDGDLIDVNEVTMSLENSLGFQTSINAENGRTSSRATKRAITGSFNPYLKSDSMENFNKFKQNTPFSLFAYAKLPSETPGEFSGVVAVYFRNCVITELSEADQDGILQDAITFSANRGANGSIPEIVIAFI